MKNFYISFRTLFKKGRHNDIKILSLGVGLAMGLVLIAKVCFELSYDNFYPESDRIFAIQENFSIGDKSNDGFPCVSGGVAPGMKAEIPGVVAATRCERTGEMVMKTPDNKKYTAIFMLADSCFYDVLPREMLVGNARETLSLPPLCPCFGRNGRQNQPRRSRRDRQNLRGTDIPGRSGHRRRCV